VAFVLTGWFYTLIYRGWAFLKDQLASERLQQDGFTPVAAQQPFLNNKN
jgi:hypothetical protein